MGNIQYQKAFRKQQKIRYKGLDENQKKYIKSKERFEQFDKALSYFYMHCVRSDSGAVDWSRMSEEELDYFDMINKEKERALHSMSNLENKIDVDYTLNMFLQTNTHSMSF